MTHTIRIPKPPCPIPVLSRPARQWKQREEWGVQTEEARPEPTSGEPDTFIATIRNLLGVKQ